MGVKLSKHIIGRVQKMHKNVEQNVEYAREMNEWLGKHLDTEFGDEELENSKVVPGEVVDMHGKEYLRVEGSALAQSNLDGTYCHQTNYCEDCYHGEYYIRIDETNFLQIHFNC